MAEARPAATDGMEATLDGQSAEAEAIAPTLASADPDGLAQVVRRAAAFPVGDWDRYEFVRLLGRGGMGAVYQARDKRLGRMVALKFITVTSPQTTARFIQEARAQSRLDHPNVCKVYEVGEVAGLPYIAMQLVTGESLDRAGRSLTQTEKVQLLRDVARAIHTAHELGIIHRDAYEQNKFCLPVTQNALQRRRQTPWTGRHPLGLWRPCLLALGHAVAADCSSC